mmetsp:Transcript_73606/g.157853  ORF Transcript_73606/g.157853 Transcript_73606/m.157853 type:complete len:203 (+) Transcript_73606:403-1011(+)
MNSGASARSMPGAEPDAASEGSRSFGSCRSTLLFSSSASSSCASSCSSLISPSQARPCVFLSQPCNARRMFAPAARPSCKENDDPEVACRSHRDGEVGPDSTAFSRTFCSVQPTVCFCSPSSSSSFTTNGRSVCAGGDVVGPKPFGKRSRSHCMASFFRNHCRISSSQLPRNSSNTWKAGSALLVATPMCSGLTSSAQLRNG